MTTNIGDGLSVGNFFSGGSSAQNGIPLDHRWVIDFVPLALANNNVATVQQSTAATALTLTAGTGVSSVVRSDGTTVLQFDVPRSASLTSGTSADFSAATFTLTAYDQYGAKFTNTLVGPSNSTVNFAKAAKQVVSIVCDSTVAANVSAGTSDVYGLPYVVKHGNYLFPKFGVTSTIAQDAGTFVLADVTTPATAATGDVRGTYKTSAASDGTKRLTIYGTITAAELAAGGQQPTAVFGITQV